MSGGEIIVILLFILIFFGSDKIPEFARIFGRTIRQVRDATQDIQRDIHNNIRDVENTSQDIKKTIESPLKDNSVNSKTDSL